MIRLLIYLRYLAVAGQWFTIWFVSQRLGVVIPVWHLQVTTLCLLGFNVLAHVAYHWRVARGTVALVVHLCADLVQLTVLLYFTGGPANPFVTLYLVPVALAAISLRIRAMVGVSMLAMALYTFLMSHHVPLPDLHGGDFRLHVTGMWVDFILSAVIMMAVLGRFMAIVLEQRRRLAEARERAMRDESLLALGTLAAGTAHELNTPLTTLGMLADEWVEGEHSPDHEDFLTMREQVTRCREHVRTLAELARRGAQGEATVEPADAFVRGCIERWHLLRPGVAVAVDAAPEAERARLRVDPSLPQALINLLNNAADAGAATGDTGGVRVEVGVEDGRCAIRILDRGPGPGRHAAAATDRARSPGLGIGMLISNASVERSGGRVRQSPRAGGGCVTEVVLPLEVRR